MNNKLNTKDLNVMANTGIEKAIFGKFRLKKEYYHGCNISSNIESSYSSENLF